MDNRPTEPFGELGTDEVVAQSHRKSDFDNLMLSGCITFSVASCLQFLSYFAPFALADPIHSSADLYSLLAMSGIPALAIGLAMSWFLGVAGLCGSLSGLVPVALFLWLRLKGAIDGVPGIEGLQPADFPAAWTWAVPTMVCTTSGLLWTGLFLLKGRRR